MLDCIYKNYIGQKLCILKSSDQFVSLLTIVDRVLRSFVKSGHGAYDHVTVRRCIKLNLLECEWYFMFVQEISKMKSSYSQVLQQMEQLNDKLNQVSNHIEIIRA